MKDYIFALVRVDTDSYHGRNSTVSYHRTEAGAVSAMGEEWLRYETKPSGKNTVRDFTYFNIDRIELLD